MKRGLYVIIYKSFIYIYISNVIKFLQLSNNTILRFFNSTETSLAVVAAFLGGGVGASLLFKEDEED